MPEGRSTSDYITGKTEPEWDNQRGAGYSWVKMGPTRAGKARRNYNVSAKMVLGKYNT